MAGAWQDIAASGWRRANQQSHLVTLVLTLAAMAIMGSLLLLMQTARVAALSHEVRQLHQTKEDWQRRNAQLTAEIAALASLNRIEQEARSRLGMVPATSHFFVTVERPPSAPEEIKTQSYSGETTVTIEHQNSPWWENLLKGPDSPARP